MSRKIRMGAAAVLACACLAGAAQAEPRTYTFGGSGNDSVQAIAASGDGRIVLTGSTDSTDGTLAFRTKTGLSGWALCVDAQGNALWSFCSRLGSSDRMDKPVFHEDGSVTVVLCVSASTRDMYELIRLDANGEVVARKTMLGDDGVWSLLRPGATDMGYILRQGETDDELTPKRFTLFDFDGNPVRELSGWEADGTYGVFQIAGRHVLRTAGERAFLSAFDAQGNEAVIAEPRDVIPNPDGYAIYLGMISLPDGGVAAAGRMAAADESGRFTRWDARGNTVFDWWIPAGDLYDVVRTERGFAALMQPYGQPQEPDRHAWALAFFGDDGVQTGVLPLGETEAYTGAIAALPDGSVAVVQDTGGLTGQSDVLLTIVPREDIP